MFCANCCRLILNPWDCATPHLARPWCMRAQGWCQLHPARGSEIQKHTILWASLFHAVTTGTGTVVPYQWQPQIEPKHWFMEDWLLYHRYRDRETILRRTMKKCTISFINPGHIMPTWNVQNDLFPKLTSQWVAYVTEASKSYVSKILLPQKVHKEMMPRLQSIDYLALMPKTPVYSPTNKNSTKMKTIDSEFQLNGFSVFQF